MVDLKSAYNIANDFFLNNGYEGVYESRETDNSWLCCGKCKRPNYGTSEVCVPKNGDEPYVFNIAHEGGAGVSQSLCKPSN